MRAIFVSYRRDDSEGEAGRLFSNLAAVFGEDSVFMDVAAVEVGRDFRKAIDDSVATCGVLLAVIGKEWVDAKNEAGQRRLDNPSDFVRLETASALKRDIPVVPVLVRGAKMPRPEQLPDDLKELAYRNGVELTHVRWNSDLEVLIKALRAHVEAPQYAAGSPRQVATGATAARKLRAPVVDEMKAPAARIATTSRSRPLGTILAVVGALVAAIFVAYAIAPKKVPVPDLAGHTLADAKAKLEAVHLVVGQKTAREGPTKDPDVILSQSPSPNTQVKTGSAVDLVVSQSSMVVVPSLAGKSLEGALRSLSDHQLQVGNIERNPKADVARDTVLQEFPAAGEQVKGGSKVDLMIADVPERRVAETGRSGSEVKVLKSNKSEEASAPAPTQTVTGPQPPEAPAQVVQPGDDVVNVSGIWHDASGATYRVSQHGNTFTYAGSGSTFISKGSGTIVGLQFTISYEAVYANGARSTGRCTGAISADGTMLRRKCLDSNSGTFIGDLVR